MDTDDNKNKHKHDDLNSIFSDDDIKDLNEKFMLTERSE